MKSIIEKTIAALMLVCATGGAWAADRTNPVTGAIESYSNIFTGGTSSEWNLADNWTLATESKVPFVSSGDYNAALVDGETATSASTAIDGWQLRVGAYNGAVVTWSSGITKIQGNNTGCWLTADDNSSITIASFAGNQLENNGNNVVFKLTSANQGGITWTQGLSSTSGYQNLEFQYFLGGNGTVVYGGDVTVNNAQVIKQADASLSGGSKSVESKDLVTFGSGTTKAFTADASVSIKQSAATKTTRTLKSVTAGGAPVKLASVTDWQVGTCELVQTSTGVKLYYVDGDYDTSYMAYIGDDPSANRHLSVAEALEAIAADDNLPKKITLLLNTEEDIVIPSVGFVFDSNGKTITGTISGASGVGVSASAGVYTGISNTAATWTGSAGDGLWENAQNWSTKSVPTSATTVTFDTDATVEMGATAEIYGLVVNSGKTFTLYRTGNSAGNQDSLWATLKIGAGQVVGGGTVKLICAGISKTIASFTINANIEFQNNGTYDSFLEETVSGSFAINGTVTGSGYLQVKTSTTFNGNVTIPSGSSIKVNSWTYDLGNGASLSGAGTLIFDGAGVRDSFKTAVQDSTKWTGTCELKSLTISNIDFADYGNENSYVGANGLSGTFKGSGVTRIADGIKGLKLTGNGLTVGGWSTDHTYVIAADISGSGPINLNIQSNAGDPLNAPASIDRVVFTGSALDFTGEVKFKQSTYRPCYIFASESDLDSLPTPTDYGQIIVMAGKTVNVGNVWTAPGGFLINGEADTKSSSAYLSGTVLGNGTVKAAYTHSSGALRAPDFGNASENTFEITEMTGGWISNAGANGMPNIKATVKLSGNVSINNGYGAADTTSNVTTFKRLAGSGNLNFSFGTGSAYANYTISTINGATNANNPYTGTITANNKARVVIGVVDVDEVPLDGRRLVGIANQNRDRFVNASGTAINNSGLIDVTVGGTADTAKLYADTDGLYVAIAQVGDSYYKSLRAAADAARAADTTFTRVYAGAGDTYPGWTYSDGVFTYDNKVAYNATKDVAYATLQDAITASSAEDIIQLLEANSETAVDTTDKDFFFDENGYAFGGTWTGSGRIVLQSAPSTTTWSSARFVTEGWTGTVAMNWEVVADRASDNGDVAAIVNKYGIATSTVEIGENGKTTGDCYFGSSPTPKLKINGLVTINDGSSNTQQTIPNISGNGVLVFSTKGAQVNYKITTLENWNGALTNLASNINIGTISSGSGVIYLKNQLKNGTDPTASSGWQGRVVLDYANIVSANDISGKFNSKYGVSGSTVEIGKNGTITGNSYFNGDLAPNLKVSGSVSVNDGSSNNRRVIPQISGDGLLVFGNKGAQVNYTVSNLVNWDGIITNKAANVRFVGFSSGNGVIVHDWAGSNSPYILAGHAGSRVVINQSGSGHLASGKANGDGAGNANFLGTLELAEGVTLTINNAWSGSNVTIGSLTGKGNLTVANTTHRWTGTVGYNIGTIDADSFTGTLTVGNEFNIGITKITRSAEPASGVPYIKAAKTHADLTDSTDGFFNVGNTTVEIGGEATSIKVAYGTIGEQSGLYKAVAQISTAYYATMQEAITAAGDANLASITVLDSTAAVPDGYYIDNNTVGKYQAMVVDSYGLIESEWFATAQGAIDSIAGKVPAERYYAIIYADATASTSLATLYAQCEGGAELTLNSTVPEYQYTKSDSPVSGTIYAYTRGDKAAAFTWNTANASGSWNDAGNWRVGGNATTRWPRIAGDAVSFASDATVTLGYEYSVGSINVGSAVVFNASDAIVGEELTVTLSASSFVLTASDASIALNSVTLSQDPTSGVDLMYVKTTTSAEGATTYALQAAGTMDGTTAEITDATAEVTVPVSATAIEADPAVSSIKLEDGSAIEAENITIKYNGTTDITGAFTVTVADNQVTIALNANGSVTISDKTITVKPAVDTSADPMTMPDETTAPSFNIKTIPGLYYVVRSGTDPSSLTAGSATQATTTTTGLAGPALGNEDTVRYYKISVGRTAAEAAQ